MQSDLLRISEYELRAEELRVIADTMHYESAKQETLLCANGYDHMARVIKNRTHRENIPAYH